MSRDRDGKSRAKRMRRRLKLAGEDSVFVVELLAFFAADFREALPSTVKSDFRRAQRAAHHLGDQLERQAFQVVQNQHYFVLLRQLVGVVADGARRFGTVQRQRGRGGRGWSVLHRHMDNVAVLTTGGLTQKIQRGVGRDPVQPRRDTVGAPDMGEVLLNFDERLLSQIFGV